MLLDTLQRALIIVFIYVTVLALVAAVKRRNDLADVGWGLGFVVVTISTFAIRETYNNRHLLILALVTLWGLRLTLHIFSRWRKHKEEDFRYQAMREKWKHLPLLQGYLQVFLLQGLLLVLVSMPILVANTYIADFSWLDLVGAVVWIFGFWFEATADKQLKSFIAEPSNKGKIMSKGLWHYSRHPNYFGEITQWWGIGLIALGLPFGWIGLIGPLTITYLITKVSGVPLLEKRYADNKDYQAYAAKTSILVPLPPKT